MIETHWLHPEWIPPVVASCLLATLLVTGARWRRRHRHSLAGRTRAGISLGRDVALSVALLAIGVALLGPRIGERTLRVPATGHDVALLFDVSRSMAAADPSPSRLAAAQAAAHQVLASLEPGDRAALVIFASRGVVLTPLTPDFAALAEFVDALETRMIVPAGSNLAAGVERALEVFDSGIERPRSVLLLSDGEDPERRPELGTGAALRANTRIVAVAFGSDAGANVRDGGVALRDAEGLPVVSRRNQRRLERLADASGGSCLAADPAGGVDGPALMRALRAGATHVPDTSADKSSETWLALRVPAVRVLPFAAFAVALLILEALIRRAPAAVRGRMAFTLPFAAAFLIAATPFEAGERVAQLESELRETPADPRRLIELGVARLESGDRLAGERALRSAATIARDPGLASIAHYDLGVAALEAGDLARARDAFFEALALAPADREARFNLEWTLDALSAEAPSESPAELPAPETRQPPEPTLLESDPTPLDDAAQRRMLLRVEDDLRSALRAAASADAPRRRERHPAW